MPDDLIRGRMIPAHLRPDPRPLRLWHYTCADAVPLIEQVGVLVPNPAARRSGLPEPVVWATDLEPGDVTDLDLALGVRGEHVTCDRTAHRFEVLDPDVFEPWTSYARRQVRAGLLDRTVRELLDCTPGGFPRHWWITTETVRARRADRRVSAQYRRP
jgi:hypothetical protein